MASSAKRVRRESDTSALAAFLKWCDRVGLALSPKVGRAAFLLTPSLLKGRPASDKFLAGQATEAVLAAAPFGPPGGLKQQRAASRGRPVSHEEGSAVLWAAAFGRAGSQAMASGFFPASRDPVSSEGVK